MSLRARRVARKGLPTHREDIAGSCLVSEIVHRAPFPLPQRFDLSAPSSQPTSPSDTRRRIHSQVALSLLEALRDQDLPAEILDDENVSITMPRRLGLSGVVDTQIRRYREEVRRRRRVPDAEVRDLMRLVVRRPDSEDVFLRVGEDLNRGERGPGWPAILPKGIQRRIVLRRIRRRLRWLFGRRLVNASRTPFVLRATDPLFIDGDPGGDACQIVTGIVRAELRRVGAVPDHLTHRACVGRGDETCVWELAEEGPGPADEPAEPAF